jgi:hypothetical protein
LDLSFLQESGEAIEEEREEMSHEGEKKKAKVERNKRIGVYIKRLLKANNGLPVSINELLTSVLKNYRQELRYIQDPTKRLKALACLKRRTYECLSVLSAVGLLWKQKKSVSPTDKIMG